MHPSSSLPIIAVRYQEQKNIFNHTEIAFAPSTYPPQKNCVGEHMQAMHKPLKSSAVEWVPSSTYVPQHNKVTDVVVGSQNVPELTIDTPSQSDNTNTMLLPSVWF